MTAPANVRRSPHTADPVVVEWYRYMTANARAHDDYMSRQTGCWPCRRCQRVFRHPLPRSRHERVCPGVKALTLPAPAARAST